MTLEEVKKNALTKLNEAILNNPDKTQAAFLAETYRKIEEADSLKVIADSLFKVNALSADVDELKKQLDVNTLQLTNMLADTMPVLYKVIANNVNNNWKYKAENWTDFKDIAGLFNSSNFEDAKLKLSELGLELKLTSKGKFFLERDFHSYGNDWNEYHIALSAIILKNKNTTNKTINLKARVSSDNYWKQTKALIVANGKIVSEFTTNNINYVDTNIEVPSNTDRFFIIVVNGAYRWTTWNGAWYALRHNIELSLEDGIEFDYQAYKEILGG
jgi:hypothetical protein